MKSLTQSILLLTMVKILNLAKIMLMLVMLPHKIEKLTMLIIQISTTVKMKFTVMIMVLMLMISILKPIS